MSTIQNGLIGFFDILGYQAFLENNPPETAADTVLAVLGKLTGLKDEMLLHMMKDLGVLQDRIEVEPQWLVFSDTVLLYLDLNKVTEPLGQEPESRGQKIELHFYVFLLQCIALWKAMFAAGLPLRGAITQGNYLVKGPCFAGIPIVQAHQLGNDLNCAGVAIDQSVEQWRNTNLPGAVGPGRLMRHSFGHSLTRRQYFVSQHKYSVGFGILLATDWFPSDLSGHKWSRSASPSSSASRSTVCSASTA